MEKVYDEIVFKNDTSPAISEANLNRMSDALNKIDDRVCRMIGNNEIYEEAKTAATYARALYGKENYTEWHGTHAEFQTIKDELIIGSVIHFTDSPKETCIYKGNNVLVPISNYTDSTYIKKQMSNPNLLDNGWFTVNSRGQSSYSGTNNYTVDRWRFTGSNTGSISVLSDGVSLNSARWYQLFKPLELGQQYTVSVMLTDGNIYSFNFIMLNSYKEAYTTIIEEPFMGGSIKINTYASPHNTDIYINGCTCSIKAVKLERGSVSTLANDSAPNYAEELLRCQTSTADSADTYANKGVATGDAWSSTKSYTSGQCLIHNNVLYKVKTNCTGIEPPNATYYVPTSITGEISNLAEKDVPYTMASGMAIVANRFLAKCKNKRVAIRGMVMISGGLNGGGQNKTIMTLDSAYRPSFEAHGYAFLDTGSANINVSEIYVGTNGEVKIFNMTSTVANRASFNIVYDL